MVFLLYRNATPPTAAAVTTGGQTWVEYSGWVHVGSSNLSINVYYCVYNGTWTGAPAFGITSGTLALTAAMHVFRPTAGFYFPYDPGNLSFGNGGAGYSAPSTPFTVTQSGFNLPDASFAIACWTTDDDNTWNTLSGSGWSIIGAQYRNTQGNDTSMAFAYYLAPVAASAPNVSLNQATLGGDPGITYSIGAKEYKKRLPLQHIRAVSRSNSY